MEKQNLMLKKIGLGLCFYFLITLTISLYLLALNNRYMIINEIGILDKWTKNVYIYMGEEKISKIRSEPKKTKEKKRIDQDDFLRQIQSNPE